MTDTVQTASRGMARPAPNMSPAVERDRSETLQSIRPNWTPVGAPVKKLFSELVIVKAEGDGK